MYRYNYDTLYSYFSCCVTQQQYEVTLHIIEFKAPE